MTQSNPIQLCLNKILKTGKVMAPCNKKACVERRTSATDPLCIQFGNCSACFKTESWRQKGAPSQPLAPGPLGIRARAPTPPSGPHPEWDQYRPEPVYTPHNPPPSARPSKPAVSNLLSRYNPSIYFENQCWFAGTTTTRSSSTRRGVVSLFTKADPCPLLLRPHGQSSFSF